MVQRRNTHQRQLVLDAVKSLGCHPTASEVYQYVHQMDEKVSLGTVYRNLNLLAESGDILAVKSPDGCHYDQRTDDHPHVVCVCCGAMADAMIPADSATDAQVAGLTGFADVSHYTVFEGICPSCQASEQVSQKAS